MKTTEDLLNLHMLNVTAEQAHKLECERLKEEYEQVEVHDFEDFQLVITSMNYDKLSTRFEALKND